MNQKQIGVILIIIGVILITFLFISKTQEDEYIREIMRLNQGSCFLEDGTCLHADRAYTNFLIGGAISSALIMLGLYLIFFDKTQKILADNQVKISSALSEAKKQEKERDEFNAFLASYQDDEKTVLKAIKEQDGILQSTLRYKAGMSKSTLSLLLKSFEEKGLISRQPSGKTNKIFFRKKF